VYRFVADGDIAVFHTYAKGVDKVVSILTKYGVTLKLRGLLKMLKYTEKCDKILTLLRKISRAIDLHSKQLVKKYGLTGPQLLLLKIIIQHKELSSSKLAEIASLSHPTVTSILDRLSQRSYVERTKGQDDRRKVIVTATESAKALFLNSPPLLQEQFVTQFYALKDWEQSQLISSLSRVADMMSAENIDASPFLAFKAGLKD